MLHKTISRAFLIFALMTFSQFAGARGLTWYAGAAYGDAEYDFSAGAFDDGSLTSSSLDDSDSGYKVLVGLGLTRTWGVEGAYIDLGEAKFDATSDGTGTIYSAGPVSQKMEATGYSLSAVFNIVSTRSLRVFAKYGYFQWESEIAAVNALGPIGGDDDGSDTVYSFGAEYTLYKKFAVRGEWEQFKDVGPGDLELVSLGAVYRF